jgi:hypothetical protein
MYTQPPAMGGSGAKRTLAGDKPSQDHATTPHSRGDCAADYFRYNPWRGQQAAKRVVVWGPIHDLGIGCSVVNVCKLALFRAASTLC